MVTQSDYGKPVFDTDGKQISRTIIGFKIEFIFEHRKLSEGHEKIDNNRFVKFPKWPWNTVADESFVIFCAVQFVSEK